LFEKVKGSFCSEQPAFQQVPTRFALSKTCMVPYMPHMDRMMLHVASISASAAPPAAAAAA
jgi:hypothetical protein